MWGNLLLGNPFHMSNSTSYLLYLQHQEKKIRKRRTSANQAARIFFSQYSFLKTYLKNNNKESQEEENRSEPLISCVSLSTSSPFGIILLDASLQWSVRF